MNNKDNTKFIIKKMQSCLKAYGGCTLDERGSMVTSGFAVSLNDEDTALVMDEFDNILVSDFIQTYIKDQWSINIGDSIGAWKRPDGKTVVLLTKVLSKADFTEKNALNIAAEYSQEYIYDIDVGVEIKVK